MEQCDLLAWPSSSLVTQTNAPCSLVCSRGLGTSAKLIWESFCEALHSVKELRWRRLWLPFTVSTRKKLLQSVVYWALCSDISWQHKPCLEADECQPLAPWENDHSSVSHGAHTRDVMAPISWNRQESLIILPKRSSCGNRTCFQSCRPSCGWESSCVAAAAQRPSPAARRGKLPHLQQVDPSLWVWKSYLGSGPRRDVFFPFSQLPLFFFLCSLCLPCFERQEQIEHN